MVYKFKRFLKKYLSPYLRSQIYKLKIKFFLKGAYGLDGIDLRLLKILKPQINKGFYIELGANDGIRMSNTYLLQKRYKWKGLLIEPIPERFKECVNNRNFVPRPSIYCGACVPFDFKERFIEIEDSDLMSIAKGLDIDNYLVKKHADLGSEFLENKEHRITYGSKAFTLTELLKRSNAPKNIDFLSIDVEGNELSILKGIDFKLFVPKWILIEVHNSSCTDIKNFLRLKNYTQELVLTNKDYYRDILFKKNKKS